MSNRRNLYFTMLLWMWACFSCSMMREVGIQSYNPSAITWPPDVKTVMIINNAAQQPDRVGHRYFSLSKADSLMTVSADSAAYLFCMSLGKAIAESPLFDDVRICNDTLRADSLFFQMKPLTAVEVALLNDEYGVDALISLDKLFFNTTLYSFDLRNVNNGNSMSIEIYGELRALWPGQKEVYVFPFSDTLMWNIDEAYYDIGNIEQFTPSDVKDAIRYFSEYMGNKMNIFFAPHWSNETRWFYVNFSSEWKRATAFATVEKWEEAGEIWIPLFEKTTKWKHKARLASNIALYYEIKGDFAKAIEYAQTSYDLFTGFAGEGNPLKALQKQYLDSLAKRRESDRKLSEQLREGNRN